MASSRGEHNRKHSLLKATTHSPCNRSTRLEPLNATGLLRFWTALGAAALPTEVHEVAILDFKVLSNTTLLTY